MSVLTFAAQQSHFFSFLAIEKYLLLSLGLQGSHFFRAFASPKNMCDVQGIAEVFNAACEFLHLRTLPITTVNLDGCLDIRAFDVTIFNPST